MIVKIVPKFNEMVVKCNEFLSFVAGIYTLQGLYYSLYDITESEVDDSQIIY